MTAESVALDHYKGRRGLTTAISRLAGQIWQRMDPGNLDASWAQYGPQLVVGVTGAQLAAARTADDYVDAALDEQGAPSLPDVRVNPSALAGVASDGRPLDSLLINAVTTVKSAIAGGATIDRAMAAGLANLDMIARTQVADAGRAADQVALVARPAATGYVRVLVGKSCSRCVILAGRRYGWNAGFKRHPRCDCIHLPVAEAAGHVTSPRGYFDSLSKPEQDKAFTAAGAQAIRDGADPARVVNARRGMYEAGDLKLTTEATTRRGINRRVRLMPEQIYREAGGDRAEALRLLRGHGYLLRTPPQMAPAARVVKVAPPIKAPAPKPKVAPATKTIPAPARKAATPKPVPAAVNALGERVKAGIVRREVLSGGANAKTELLTLADGSKVVFKKAHAIEGVTARMQQDAEELVPVVLRAAGLRAPGIYRPSPNQLYMEHFEGDIASKHRAPGSHAIDPAFYDADQGLLLGLVDQLTDNYDRNGGNWLLGKGGEVLPIDHGFAFTYYGSSPPERVRVAIDKPASAFHGSHVPHIGDWVDNDMSPADLRELRSRLVALRPEFERLGRGDWHDKMLIRLGKVEQYAKGTKRRIR